MIPLLLTVLALGHPCHYQAGGALPDIACTGGATDGRVKQYTDWHDDPMGPRIDNTQRTICVAGWTAKVRPPSSYTSKLKLLQMRRYGATGPPSAYEEDHLIPLALGGAPRDPHNLWPMPIRFARRKDVVERKLQKLVCSGKVKLLGVRGLMATDWRAAGRFADWAAKQP